MFPLKTRAMIFGFSHFSGQQKVSSRFLQTKLEQMKTNQPSAEAQPEFKNAQIYDLAHHRKLKALHSLIERGATLSEAARLVGVSRITAHRWNDHGRR